MHQTALKYGEKEKLVVVSTKEKAIRELPLLVEQAGFQVASNDLVLVKPNVCGMYPPSIDLLRAIIQHIKPHSKSIIIGETPSMGHSPNERFESLGIKRLAEHLGVAVRDLMEDTTVSKRVPKPHAMKEIPLPSTVLEADLLVNVPGLGTHGNTLLTCALKNLFGLIAVRRKYSRLHPKGVSKVVADVFQLVKPQLNVVDFGRQVLVGTDALSVDVVACEFKSLSPSRVRHLVLAAQDLGLELRDLHIRRIEL
ncbi:MAG: DUF362 domain-containing protein [Candidatus Bathyarchaeota archaeon]|nr:DUF362 domain-containing protein [Candidatus Bathyarchaeota archaeon]